MAAIVTELELTQILRKMLWADMDMSAVDPALELRPEPLDAIDGRAVFADIFLDAVIDLLMPVAVDRRQSAAGAQRVGVDLAVGLHIRHDVREQGSALTVNNNVGDYVTAALAHPQHDSLALATHAVALVTADESLVDFNSLERPAKRRVAIHSAHVFADFVAHPPSRFVGHADLAFDFFGGDPIPRSAELEHDKEPVAKAGPCPVERGSGSRIDLRSAPLASVGAAGFDAVELGIPATLFAIVASTVANAHEVIEAAFFGRKAVLKLAESGGFAHV